MTGQAPPGWYRDPYGTPGLQRYWDGDQWTQVTQPDPEWGGGGAQQAPPGYLLGGAGDQPTPGSPPAGDQPASGYPETTAGDSRQPASGYGQPQAPQQQSTWATPGGGADWGAGARQAWQQQAPAGEKSNKALIWAL